MGEEIVKIYVPNLYPVENHEFVFNTYYQKCLDDFDSRKKIIELNYLVGFDNKLKKNIYLTKLMKISTFLVNMVFWKPYVMYNKTIEVTNYFDCRNINSDSIAKKMDYIIADFINSENVDTVNYFLSEIIYELSLFSYDFNIIIANTINLKDKIDLAKRNPEYYDLIHTQLDETLPYHDIEDILKAKTTRLIDIMKKEDNCFRDYLNCKEGINKNQLTQFEVAIGPLPDLKGNVYPHIINTNFLVKGLRNVADYYIDSCGGRKASIINHMQVKKAGYSTRKLTLLCIDTLLDYDIDDCGSKHYMKVHIDSKMTLNRLNLRWGIVDDSEEEKFITDQDVHLIGKTIKLRSPITCQLTTGKFCKRCYGDLWWVGNGIHAGILGVTTMTCQLTQQMLSAKHLLKTDSEIITWPKFFNKFFTVIGNSITIHSHIDDLENYTLIIQDIAKDNELTGNPYTQKIKILSKKLNKYKSFVLEKKLFLSKELEEIYKNVKEIAPDYDQISIPFDKLTDIPLFYIEIENKELSKSLNLIIELIDNKHHLGITNKDDLLQKFLSLLNDGQIEINSVHIELIIREMLRDKNMIYNRPDFSKEDGYKILRISDSILNSPSLINSLAFEKIKSQLYDWKTYKYKNKESILDYLFKCSPLPYSK